MSKLRHFFVSGELDGVMWYTTVTYCVLMLPCNLRPLAFVNAQSHSDPTGAACHVTQKLTQSLTGSPNLCRIDSFSSFSCLAKLFIHSYSLSTCNMPCLHWATYLNYRVPEQSSTLYMCRCISMSCVWWEEKGRSAFPLVLFDLQVCHALLISLCDRPQ